MHGKIICSNCRAVVSQCRCPGGHRHVPMYVARCAHCDPCPHGHTGEAAQRCTLCWAKRGAPREQR